MRTDVAALALLVTLTPPLASQAMFDEAEPLQSIMRPSGGSPFLPLPNPEGGTTFCYAPAGDIGNPLLNATGEDEAEPHGSQELTIFQPSAPILGDPFPTVLYSTAGEFAEAPGNPPVGLLTFLGLALERGWCVVTVGGVGFNSEPTDWQIRRCNLNGGGSNPPPCWDYNLWYPPDGQLSPPSPWNDFNYFYGEKDLVWARQWVAENAATYDIDNDRVVVSGSSTGAIYASFLAYQPNRAWSGPEYSSQSQQDTRVAAFVGWDLVAWMEAIPNLPFPQTLQGVHWPQNLTAGAPGNAYRERIPLMTTGIPSEQLLALRSHGPSHYMRQYQPLVPTWLGSGDPFFAIFGRNAAQVLPEDDYARDPSSVPPGDPTLSFPVSPTPTVIHDLWNLLIFKQDLIAADSAYYARHGRVELRDDTNWTSIPAELSNNEPPVPPLSAAQVPLVDGSFIGATVCASLGFPAECLAVENLAAATKAVAWMGREVCRNYGPAVQCRNLGINFSVLTFTPAAIGGTSTGKVFLCECPNGYDAAWIFGYDSPGQTPLATGDVLLCQDGGSGELLGLTPKLKSPSGVVTFEIDIPNDPGLVGTMLYTQAWMYDYDGLWDSALTNAQDLEIQP